MAGAVALAAVGGGAIGLGTPLWLGGSAGAVAALAAFAIVERVFRAWDERRTARTQRAQVLDALTTSFPGDEDDVLGRLRPGRSTVPFRGMTSERRQLTDWAADESASPTLMVTGSAGVGKSRLVLEFALGLPRVWAVGWLHVGAGAAAVRAVRACGDPAIILVDDADGRPDVVALLDALAEHHVRPQVRVVLITRSATSLRSWLARQVEEKHQWITDLAAELEVVPHGSPEDRQRWFSEAVTAFSADLRASASARPGPMPAGLSDACAPMLDLQARALLAVLGGGPVSKANLAAASFIRVAESLMDHEKRRWRAITAAVDWGIGGPPGKSVQEHCVAALALLGPVNQAEAISVLRRIPELADATGERLISIASWAAELYPYAPGVAPRIGPDMIGEWFVVSQLTADPGLSQRLRDGMTEDQAARALSFLARAADRLETADGLFAAWSAGDIRRLVLAATQATTTGKTGQRLLDPVLASRILSADGWTIERLNDLDQQIPRHVLLATQAAIADRTVALYRSMAKATAACRVDLARALDILGDCLGQAGRNRDALTAGREAVALYRSLADTAPGAHLASLASALDRLGVWHGRAGEYQDAAATSREAISIYRSLLETAATHQAGLAHALDYLGVWLDRAAEHPSAFAASREAEREAVALYRSLAKATPGAHKAGLAHALSNLGAALDRAGEYREAAAACREAVALYRSLAKTAPAAHQAGLAGALITLATVIGKTGEDRDAQAACREAVTLYRSLAEAAPAAHQAGLARAVVNLAVALGLTGEYQDALAPCREAVALYRSLAKTAPAAHQAGLAYALDSLAAGLDRIGKYRDAVAANREAVALCRSLAKAAPATHQARLAHALNNLGAGLVSIGEFQAGVDASREAVALYRSLADTAPGAHQVDLARTLHKLGIRLDRVDKREESLTAQTESVDVYRALALADPGLYQDKYRQELSRLRREYEMLGMNQDAIRHHLGPRRDETLFQVVAEP